MRVMVMESINARSDRALVVQEAPRRALTEPGPGIFTRNGVEYFHLMTPVGTLLIGIYHGKGENIVPFEP